MMQLLLDNKSPLDASDISGLTALHHGLQTSLLDLKLRANCRVAIAEGHGDTALLLLKSGAVTDKKDVDGHMAIELAPDDKVRFAPYFSPLPADLNRLKSSSCRVRKGKVSNSSDDPVIYG